MSCITYFTDFRTYFRSYGHCILICICIIFVYYVGMCFLSYSLTPFLAYVVHARPKNWITYIKTKTQPICTYNIYSPSPVTVMFLYIDTVWSGPLAKCLTIDPFLTQILFIIHIYIYTSIHVYVSVCVKFLRVFSTNSVLKIKPFFFRRNGVQTQTIFQKSELEP